MRSSVATATFLSAALNERGSGWAMTMRTFMSWILHKRPVAIYIESCRGRAEFCIVCLGHHSVRASQVGILDFRAVEQFIARAGQYDLAVLQDVRVVRQPQRMVSVLLDEQNRYA